MRTQQQRSGDQAGGPRAPAAEVKGTRERPRAVLLGAVVLLGTSALVVLGLAEERPVAGPEPASVRSGATILRNELLTAEAPPTPPEPPAAVTADIAPRKGAAQLVPAPVAKRTHVVAAVGGDDRVELGRRLFFDPAASHSKRVSCASCHKPEHGFSDPALRSTDDFGLTPRHSQTVLNIAATAPLHWDGEFTSLEDLITSRTGDQRAVDGGYASPGSQVATRKVTPVAESLAREGLYESAFTTTFGRGTPTKEQLSEVIAAYVRTLASTTSPFDRYVEGDANALSPEAVRGSRLFAGRAGCTSCHSVDGFKPTFTDGQFHNTGVAMRRGNGHRGVEMKAEGPFADGRKRLTRRESDARAMKTPSLRDVATRAPYMHDGSFPTLASVVRYYAVECGQSGDPSLDSRLTPFDAGKKPAEVEADVADLVAFLGALTGERRAGLAETAWFARATTMRLKLVDKQGAPIRSIVAVQPGGDVLPATTPDPVTPRYLTPDIDGWIEIQPFASTHVKVSLSGSDLRPVSGELVPDTCAEGVLTLVSAAEMPQVLDSGVKSKRRR